MAKFEGKFESASQEWETPLGLFDALDKYFDFNFDLAADSDNKKCERFFSKKDNALSKNWVGRCWLNPPYGGSGENKLAIWVEKAYNESRKKNCSVTMLIPARTNTNWWHDFCMKANEIFLIKGRPKFGGAKHGLPQPLSVIHFDGIDARSTAKFSTISLKTENIYQSKCV